MSCLHPDLSIILQTYYPTRKVACPVFTQTCQWFSRLPIQPEISWHARSSPRLANEFQDFLSYQTYFVFTRTCRWFSRLAIQPEMSWHVPSLPRLANDLQDLLSNHKCLDMPRSSPGVAHDFQDLLIQPEPSWQMPSLPFHHSFSLQREVFPFPLHFFSYPLKIFLRQIIT